MRAVRPFQRLAICSFIACLAISAAAASPGQEEERSTKVPLIGKLGSSRQAFSGIVQSVDTKRKLLLVNAVEGSYTEYFPVKPHFLVTTAKGTKIPVKKLEVHIQPALQALVALNPTHDGVDASMFRKKSLHS